MLFSLSIAIFFLPSFFCHTKATSNPWPTHEAAQEPNRRQQFELVRLPLPSRSANQAPKAEHPQFSLTTASCQNRDITAIFPHRSKMRKETLPETG
jgi:hypothetical protein